MRAFVSYSRRDQRAVEALVADLDRARCSSWVDNELGGGEDWWREILEQIRTCDVFVFATSNNSVRSRPCLAELEYATALGLPVLPVQIGPVDSLRMTPIAEKQVIDYRVRAGMPDAEVASAHAAIDLVVAAADLTERRRPLPTPLPPEPGIPFEYLMQISIALDAAELPGRVQLQILTQLKQALRDEQDPAARSDVVELLQRLRRHPDTSYRNATDVDEMLAQLDDPVPDPPAPGPLLPAAAVDARPPAREVAPPRTARAAVADRPGQLFLLLGVFVGSGGFELSGLFVNLSPAGYGIARWIMSLVGAGLCATQLRNDRRAALVGLGLVALATITISIYLDRAGSFSA